MTDTAEFNEFSLVNSSWGLLLVKKFEHLCERVKSDPVWIICSGFYSAKYYGKTIKESDKEKWVFFEHGLPHLHFTNPIYITFVDERTPLGLFIAEHIIEPIEIKNSFFKNPIVNIDYFKNLYGHISFENIYEKSETMKSYDKLIEIKIRKHNETEYETREYPMLIEIREGIFCDIGIEEMTDERKTKLKEWINGMCMIDIEGGFKSYSKMFREYYEMGEGWETVSVENIRFLTRWIYNRFQIKYPLTDETKKTMILIYKKPGMEMDEFEKLLSSPCPIFIPIS